MNLIDVVNSMEVIDAKRNPMERCAGRVQWGAIRRAVLRVEQAEAREAKLREANLGLASALAESQGRERESARRIAALEDALAASPEPPPPEEKP